MLYTGIDLHKRTVVMATVDEKGKVLCEASVPSVSIGRGPLLPLAAGAYDRDGRSDVVVVLAA